MAVITEGALQKRALRVPGAMNEAWQYSRPSAFSRGMEVRLPGARLVFVSGTASVGVGGQTLHAGDFKAQARRMYRNVRAVLREGGTDWSDVVKATVYLTKMSDYPVVNEIYAGYMGKVLPARCCVAVRELPADEIMKLDVIAYKGERG